MFSSHQVDCHFYADDTQFWVPYSTNDRSSENIARSKIFSLFTDIKSWMATHSLKLNTSKSLFLPISKTETVTEPLELGDTALEPMRSVRNLGVIFNNRLDMSDQVMAIRKSSFYHLRRITSIRDFVTQDQFASLVHAFISSRLDYCNSLLFGTPSYSIHKLQLIQNAAARSVVKADRYSSASQILQQLHWLPLKKRIAFKLATLGFKIYHKQSPSYFHYLSSKHSTVSTRSTCHPVLQSTIQKVRTTRIGDRCYFRAIPTVFNSLPAHIRDIDKYDDFKKELKTYLFTNV